MPQFTGKLNVNSVMSNLYNMIISQEITANNVDFDDEIVKYFRVDGTMYGDTKLYIDTDGGLIRDFPDESGTLLTKRTPKEPKVQAITIDTFKQTAVTVDGVKLKQAFMSENIYGAYCSVIVAWTNEVKKIYDYTKLVTFIGTTEGVGSEGTQNAKVIDTNITDSTTDGPTKANQGNQLNALRISEAIENIFLDLFRPTRKYNGYGFMRGFRREDMVIVFNSKYYAAITKLGLPKIFHEGEVLANVKRFVVHNDYFGAVINTGGTIATETYRFLEPTIVKVSATDPTTYDAQGVEMQFYAGDVVPKGYTYVEYEVYESQSAPAYMKQDDVICVIMHKKCLPFMSAFKVASEFYNSKDLDRTHYLTWGHNTLELLQGKPCIRLTTEVI